MQAFQNQTFLISRTDAIGDVVLTLPMCDWLKKNIPGAKVLFLGRTYTKPVIASCAAVDKFLNWDDLQKLSETEQVAQLKQENIDVIVHVFPNKEVAWLARNANIPVRIGTRNRWFHWLTCNKLVALSRKNSLLHESQLNLELLRPVGLQNLPGLTELPQYLKLEPTLELPETAKNFFKIDVPHIIFHPKSKGHGREWPLANYAQLAKELTARGMQVFVSGSEAEHNLLKPWLAENQTSITDITGRLSLPEFIAFIKHCDGMVCSGTGPLHLAAGLGIHALGIFPPIRPIHPGRWAPVGPKAEYLVEEKDCSACKGNPAKCVCIMEVPVAAVLERVEAWFEK
jgi:heptosyltransferase-3